MWNTWQCAFAFRRAQKLFRRGAALSFNHLTCAGERLEITEPEGRKNLPEPEGKQSLGRCRR